MTKASKDTVPPSMEEILQTIRGVISGDNQDEKKAAADTGDDDVLELTDMVADDGSVTRLKPTANENISGEGKAADVLANIDNALKKSAAAPEAAASPKNAAPPEEELTELRADEEEEEALLPDVAEANAIEPETGEPQEPAKKKSYNLISEATAKASTQALQNLVHKVPKPHVDGPSFRSGVTLEALVIEAMKPELSAWLDKNLPTLVTHLVEKEIKKLLPGPDEA